MNQSWIGEEMGEMMPQMVAPHVLGLLLSLSFPLSLKHNSHAANVLYGYIAAV